MVQRPLWLCSWANRKQWPREGWETWLFQVASGCLQILDTAF